MLANVTCDVTNLHSGTDLQYKTKKVVANLVRGLPMWRFPAAKSRKEQEFLAGFRYHNGGYNLHSGKDLQYKTKKVVANLVRGLLMWRFPAAKSQKEHEFLAGVRYHIGGYNLHGWL